MTRRSRNPKLMGNHQRAWVWGRHAVLEAVRSTFWHPQEVRASLDLDAETREELTLWVEQRSSTSDTGNRPQLVFEPPARLEELCHHADHQGLIARMPAYPYLTEESLLKRLTSDFTLLVLDELQDAFNFGACLRCADVFGVDAILVGTSGQSTVNAQVIRSSAGAIHHVPIVQSADLTNTLTKLKSLGVTLVAATEKASDLLPDAHFSGAVALVVGNEGAGIDQARSDLCSKQVRIPQWGLVQSLNVAVASGVVLYEIARQRNSENKEIS